LNAYVGTYTDRSNELNLNKTYYGLGVTYNSVVIFTSCK